MGTPATLPLSSIVNVSVFVSPQVPNTPTYNIGLIGGNSPVIPSWGANSRVRTYQTTQQMLSDGFTPSTPEYIAAQLYFGQATPPINLMVGRQDATSIATLTTHAGNQGTGYIVGDLLFPVQGGASNAVLRVTTVGGSGQVTGVSIVQDGTGFTVASGLTTTTNSVAGAGAEIDVLSVGETPLVALQYCRSAAYQWWACMWTTAVTADHEAIAAYVQSMSPVGYYLYDTQDVAALNGTSGNVFSVLKAANYGRVYGKYATAQSGLAPNNPLCAAAMIGVAMGLNTGLAGSAFTGWGKTLVGVIPEPLTPSNIATIQNNNGNLYLSYANGAYELETAGVSANGQYLDQVLNLDMLTANIQYSLMNLLVSVPKVPQTDPGQTQLLAAVQGALETAFELGFLGPGVWQGPQIVFTVNGNGGLVPGTALSHGYWLGSPPYSQQSQANKAARQAMPIYAAITPAGAVQSIVVGVYVNI